MAAPAPAHSTPQPIARPVREIRAPVRIRTTPGEWARHVPAATYRLQFGSGVGFSAARRLIPFLDRLGVTHVYASPIFAARRGSPHGYDVTSPLRLNPELGTDEEFDALVEELQNHGMGLILDIVPNHMAATVENPWWEDVLEDGSQSVFAGYFDIDWKSAPPGLTDRTVLPVLGAPYGSVLENAELQLALDERGFFLRYWEHRFPLSVESYRAILLHRFSAWKHSAEVTRDTTISLDEIAVAIQRLPAGPEAARSRLFAKRSIKARLWDLYRADTAVRTFLDGNLRDYNGAKGDPESFERLDRVLSQQPYVLTYWRTGREQVNYRRFFDINELVGMRVEDEEVFGATHALIFRLARAGKIAGLRIDHVDGLYDPAGYLRRLEDCLASPGMPRRLYVVTEKITLGDEGLAEDWAVCGTTGYDFLNAANAVFVDGKNMPRLEATYRRFTGIRGVFDEHVYQQKKRVIRDLFSGELRRLSTQLQALAALDRHARDARPEDFSEAIAELTAALPVYRTYIRSNEISASDRKAIEVAIEAAAFRAPALSGPALEFLRRVLLLDVPDLFPADQCADWLKFVMRWQQFSGPVMAKGMEDTACYVYNRLVSLNVVGGGLKPVTVEEFHSFNRRRLSWPYGLNATSTHDTKRSEDVCARINVLSELPDLWEDCVQRWSRWNRGKKRLVGGVSAPGANDEILLYQVLLGAWPLADTEVSEFKQRLRGFVVKAAREAKTHTSWLSPDGEYEEALLSFVEAILEPRSDNRFLPDFLRTQAMIAPFGAIGSLAQVLLKICCPGVPDFYQGTLLWDFSLVDPDNRRPVDFTKRIRLLGELAATNGSGPIALLEDLRERWYDGRIKLYMVAKALEHRRARRELFLSGDYIPLEVRGPAAEHVMAFARRKGENWTLVAVPRLLAAICGGRDPFGKLAAVWPGTEIRIPGEAPAWWDNIFTGERLAGSSVPVSKVFGRFPVAVLSAGTTG